MRLERADFRDLPGWGADEADALVAGVSRHLPEAVRARPAQARWLAWFQTARGADETALAFVERAFVPLRLTEPAFFTGYYEPVIAASRVREGRFQTPIYRRPDDLVRVAARADLPGDGTWGRMSADGAVVPYFDRAAIMGGALAGRGLELFYLADPVDAFFAQVQGSARLSLPDGSKVRIGYHGKTGHSYTAIGRVLIDEGALPEGGATMQTIRAWLAAHPDDVARILEANRSYVFFRERDEPGADLGPVAAGGVPLVPWRSLAVDRTMWRHGMPAYVETDVPGRGALAQVMMAEDAGSAIVGAGRGDIFMGTGDAAGDVAGAMKAPGRLTMIVPRHTAEALLAGQDMPP